MWWRVLSCFLLAVGWVNSARADLREAAYRAQSMLGPEVWSRVVKIKNSRPDGMHPPVVYALVFELEQRLWFYAGNSGTESLSLERGRLEEDKRALGPLLREIYAGFRRHEVLASWAESDSDREPGELPHGCFIESLAYLHALVRAGESPDEASLLAYYVGAQPGLRGHTVLYFARGGVRYYYDPAARGAPRKIPHYVGAEAIAIARETLPGNQAFMAPERAQFLPLRVPAPPFLPPPARERLAQRARHDGGSARVN